MPQLHVIRIYEMSNTTMKLILLFAVMFFWAASIDAFAQNVRCFDSGGLIKCIHPDGSITTVVRS